MIQPPEPSAFEKLLSASWTLFRRNWIVAAPMFIAAFVILAAVVAFAGIALAIAVSSGFFSQQHAPSGGFIALIVVFYLVLLIGSIALALWAQCATFGMADAAWERGTTTLADGNAAFRSRAGAVLLAVIGLIGVTILAFILALPTLGIALLALPLFTMYVLPAAVGGRRDGFEAIAESFKLVRWNFAPSVITALVLYAISYGISFLAVIPILPLEFAFLPAGDQTTPQIPPIPLFLFAGFGYIAAIALSLAYQGFSAIALTGLYRSLTSRAPVSQPATATTIVPSGPP
ncbi:MAG TPA: hypothetical protein VFE70_05885 [Candidatus Elarobacter sp.]|nr:hypothetical protein [Candidatus Elarobacter sp.]